MPTDPNAKSGDARTWYGRPVVADAHAIYLTGEDHLRFSSFANAAGFIIAIEGRFIDLEGRIIPIAERHVAGAGGFAEVVTMISMGEGYLANIMARETVSTPAAGELPCILEIVRGRFGAIQPVGCLFAGDLIVRNRLAWPAPR